LKVFPERAGRFDWTVPSGEMPGSKDMRWDSGEVLIIFMLALKENHDLTVTGCNWTEGGVSCTVKYKLMQVKPGIAFAIGENRGQTDLVIKSFGVVTTRLVRSKPPIVAEEDK
jgi:hypothetical protein